jgi:type III secretion protein V
MIEDTIRRAVTRTPSGAFLTLPPPQARDVIAAVRRAIGEGTAALGTPAGAPPGSPAGTTSPGNEPPIVILTQPDIRRFVRKLVDVDFPEATVVSFAELLPEVSLRPLARAHLGGIG